MKNHNYLETNAYPLLKEQFALLQHKHMRELFKEDANRYDNMHVQLNNLLFDFSKNRLNSTTMQLLVNLANEMELGGWINAMFDGKRINVTENRPVLHTALRSSNTGVTVDNAAILPEIKRVLNQMKSFSNGIISGNKKGYSNKLFTDVVNIGIGGSDLGPVMVCEALKYYKTPSLNVHFVSNVDGTHIVETLKKLNPETTLFLIASKTFTTQETMANAHTAREWFLAKAADESHISKHFVALSTAGEEVKKFGISPENMFEFWDWVGGRYSLWSAIGLSICLAVGYDNFEELLKGADAMDQHFCTADFDKNIPVLMGLIGFWYVSFFKFNTQAIIPYDQYLHRFPAYLQQADMESNGKYVDRNGNRVTYETGPIIWGEPGTNGQHAFFQLMHQGTSIIPADFIATAHSLNPTGNHHNLLLSNYFAQTAALMNGKTKEEVTAELKARGFDDAAIAFHLPFRIFEGNRPTNSILLDKLTPFNLGMLIAAYEHKIFVQGILWNIYSFDQWGVELGKQLANAILPELTGGSNTQAFDSSTANLIKWAKQMKN